MFYFFKKFESLAFGGLGELFKSSLATKNPIFQQLTIWTQDYVNHRNPVDVVFNKIFGNGDFGGLGELFNSSLATEKPIFRKLTIWTQDYVNHRKPVDVVFNKILERKLSTA